jgi:hypothetical protein
MRGPTACARFVGTRKVAGREQNATPSRKIPLDVLEAARDRARALADTEAFARSRDDRKKIEMRFAHLKTHHGLQRKRLRGLSCASPKDRLL